MLGGRILFIDAYDSFSNSIIHLLQERLSVTVDTLKIDDPHFISNNSAFYDYLQQFDAVVAGPGPGHPSNHDDVGLIAKLWTLPDTDVLPVLGICLGFQSLCLSHGFSLGRLSQPRHGLITPITHRGEDIYTQIGDFKATQYHSLHVQTGIHACSENRWVPEGNCKQLIPLAWDLSDPENGPILMAVKHASKPFRGIQYHPESICSDGEGHKVIDNWWRKASIWNSTHRASRTSKLDRLNDILEHKKNYNETPYKRSGFDSAVQWTSCKPPTITDVAYLVQELRETSEALEPLLLESGTWDDGNPINPETGRFSIIGLQDVKSSYVRYWTGSHTVEVFDGNEVAVRKCMNTSEVLEILEKLVETRRAYGGPSKSPFWGGFVGYISYEAGLETIDVAFPEHSHPDVWFVLAERSVVVDHVKGTVYLQSLRDDDSKWLDETKERICGMTSAMPALSEGTSATHVEIKSEPKSADYQGKVRNCQERLRAGESYELCLTECTHISNTEDPWSLYVRLRAANPAPFSAYLNLVSDSGYRMGAKVVGSSPERFLSWSRRGECQFRPIKGTVRKTSSTTRAMAEEQLNTPKEQAENLMIVDLIRHDLAGVEGVETVQVSQLMSVEEYATVFQLVSVISGSLRPGASGIPVLGASLPPGSMTGAPKKRSCAILRDIEGQKPRGLYSGVLGYFDVGGGGDFNVFIRSAFQFGDGDWQIGAGGAITVLSEEQKEWEEMITKRERVLKVFQGL